MIKHLEFRIYSIRSPGAEGRTDRGADGIDLGDCLPVQGSRKSGVWEIQWRNEGVHSGGVAAGLSIRSDLDQARALAWPPIS